MPSFQWVERWCRTDQGTLEHLFGVVYVGTQSTASYATTMRDRGKRHIVGFRSFGFHTIFGFIPLMQVERV